MNVHSFGQHEGAPVFEATIASKAGATAKVLTWGAALRDLVVPHGQGKQRVTLGLNSIEDYVAYSPYFGATPGRYANRIANGRFSLDGAVYNIARKPDEKHALHGGPDGFGHRAWKLGPVDASSATLEFDSPDGDQGFPGALRATCVYRLLEPATLRIEPLRAGIDVLQQSLRSISDWRSTVCGSARPVDKSTVTIAINVYWMG